MRLRDERRRRLADPVLGDGGREPAERVLSLVERAREPEGRHRRRLRVEAQVREDVLHERLVREEAAERGAVRGVGASPPPRPGA